MIVIQRIAPPGNDSNNNNDNSSGNGKGWSLDKEYDNNSGSDEDGDNKSCTPPSPFSSYSAGFKRAFDWEALAGLGKGKGLTCPIRV